MKKKLILLLSVLLLLSLLLAGCKGKGDGRSTLETPIPVLPETDPQEETPGLEPVNYDRDIRVLQRVDCLRDEWNPEAESASNMILGEALAKRNFYLEDKYNIRFVHSGILLDEATTKLQIPALNGDNLYDFVTMSPSYTSTVSLSGALRSIQSIPNIDLSKPWWYTELNETMSYRDTNFFVIGSSNVSALWVSSCVFYNMDMAIARDIEDDFFQMVRDHEWTLEAMLAVAEAVGYSDNDTVSDVSPGDQFGIGMTAGGWYGAFYGSGLYMASKNDEGKFEIRVNGTMGSRLVSIVNFQNAEYAFPMSMQEGNSWDSFRDGNEFFLLESISAYNTVKDSVMEYGILPIPLLTKGQPTYYNTFHRNHSSAISVPISVPEADLAMVGAILEDANYYARKVQWPAFYETLLQGRAAKNPQSAEMVEYLFTDLILDPAMLWTTELDNKIRSLIANNSYTSVTSSINKIKPGIQASLDSMMETYDKLIDGKTES